MTSTPVRGCGASLPRIAKTGLGEPGQLSVIKLPILILDLKLRSTKKLVAVQPA
jgi:hypothetical protein